MVSKDKAGMLDVCLQNCPKDTTKQPENQAHTDIPTRRYFTNPAATIIVISSLVVFSNLALNTSRREVGQQQHSESNEQSRGSATSLLTGFIFPYCDLGDKCHRTDQEAPVYCIIINKNPGHSPPEKLRKDGWILPNANFKALRKSFWFLATN